MTHPVAYARRLGLFSATMLVVGGIIGSGIFLNPAVVAQRVGTSQLTLVAWGLGALVAILGAFIFAELGARSPAAGGGYAYLREAFGPLPAFLYGWALVLAIASGATAAVAVTFANYASPLIGLAPGNERMLAVSAILVFSLINVVGVAPGAWVQNLFTLLKLGALAALILAGLTFDGGASGAAALSAAGEASLTPAVAPLVAPLVAPDGALAVAVALGTAMVPVLFAYGGWQQTNFVAEELLDARRNLPRALIVGVLIVAGVYLLANVAYLDVLGVDGLARSGAPAADVMEARFGATGRGLIAAGIAASTAGFLDLVILANPRVYQAMARDGLFFRSLAHLHPRTRTPIAAIALQAFWSIALIYSGTYGDLLDWVTFADWIFFGATAATLLVFRARATDATEVPHFRAPFHPWTTIAFLLATLYVVVGAIISNPVNAVRGTLVLLAGIPVFLWWRRGSDTGRAPTA